MNESVINVVGRVFSERASRCSKDRWKKEQGDVDVITGRAVFKKHPERRIDE